MNTRPIVLGTAGHIDHGKTALVRALTGIDTDRLKVEKERGITTELGFAHLDLGDHRLGFVDVPGHERFIKAMVAGAGGLDLVALVIAADEGIMPQTREHLDICQLLGVRRGLVVLAKSDLVDAEWLDMVATEVREGLSGTFLADAPILPVSAKTGAGLGELRSALRRAVRELPPRTAEGAFRLPLDRVFTIKGFGTVVTGTVVGGRVRDGDAVVVLPAGREARVRGVQVHGKAVTSARAGCRAAVNLAGIDRDQIGRGDWLAHPAAVRPSHLVDARFHYLATSRAPLGRRSQILLHHGTTQVMASLVLVDRDQLEPGESALAQLRVDASHPLVALPGDRFIARGTVVQSHYGTTLGGGEILRVHAPKVRRTATAAVDAVRALAGAQPPERLALEIRAAGTAEMSADELGRRLGWAAGDLDALLTQLTHSGDIVRYQGGAGACYCHAEPFARLEAAALDLVDRHEEQHATGVGVSREELRARLPASMSARLYEEVLASLQRRGALVSERDLVRRHRRDAPAGPALGPLAQTLAGQFATWGLSPTRPAEIHTELGKSQDDCRRALDQLLSAGVIQRVKPDLYMHADALTDLRQRLLGYFDDHAELSVAGWKDLSGVSRKYSIPLAEYFDKQGVTMRRGNVRVRRGG